MHGMALGEEQGYEYQHVVALTCKIVRTNRDIVYPTRDHALLNARGAILGNLKLAYAVLLAHMVVF